MHESQMGRAGIELGKFRCVQPDGKNAAHWGDLVWGRDEERDFLDNELSITTAGHGINALFRQHRTQRQHSDILRPVGHWQDNPFY